MSLNNALQIGRSGLISNQAAINVAGNNLANVATRGYHRQTVALEPVPSQEIQTGVFLGRGVQVQSIVRQVSSALESRIRNSVSEEAGSAQEKEVLSQVESLESELTGSSLSTQLDELFSAFSELANRPLDNTLRTLAVQQGGAISTYIKNLREGLTTLRSQTDSSIAEATKEVNDLLTRIEQLTGEVVKQERGDGPHTASAVLDQRDELLKEVARYIDISVVQQNSGAIDVYVGSLPIMINGMSRGVEVLQKNVNGAFGYEVVVADDQSPLDATAGRLGALILSRKNDVQGAVDALDRFTKELIYQVNRVHSQGQGIDGFKTVTGTTEVVDATAALNSSAGGAPFDIKHGSFQVHVTQKSTGQRVTSTILVDLDGISASGDTSLTSLTADVDAIANINASVTPNGALKIAGDTSDYQITFSDDTSGALAALGMNTFFSGINGSDIGVNSLLGSSPGLVAAGQGHVEGDNRTALAIAGLRTQGIDSLGGLSLSELWNKHVGDYAIRVGQAEAKLQADTVVRENLESQQQTASGVNTDEEAIDLLSYQRAYQASARFLSVVDELMQTLVNLI